MRLSVEGTDNDPAHRLELDLVGPLLQRVPQVLRGRGVDEVIVDDSVADGGGVHRADLFSPDSCLRLRRGGAPCRLEAEANGQVYGRMYVLAGKLDVRSRLSWARVWNGCHASVIRHLRGDLYPALPESPGFSCERGRKDENSWC